MMATADSNINRSNWVKIKIEIRKVDKEFPVFPKRVNKRCPAIIFADKRTAKVPGRITFLIVSIITIKGISTEGVPWGTRCANICFVLLIHPNNIKLSHRGKARESVIVIWLVLVKIYGNNPKKLLNKINENREINIKVVPLNLLIPINILNSLWRVKKILFQKRFKREGRNQKIMGKNKIPKIELNQLRDKLKMLVDGSKIENKFIIIFNLRFENWEN